MRYALLVGCPAERRSARLKPGLDRFRDVACARIVITEHGGLAALSDRCPMKTPRFDAGLESAPLLLEQGGIGDFLYHRVLECEDGALRFLDAIHNPGVLQCPQRVFQRLAAAWKYVENTFIIELPPEDGGNLGDTLGWTEAIKALHQ